MKVKYIKDLDYDSFMIWAILSSSDPSGVENRVKSMGISGNVLKRIQAVEEYEDIKKSLDKYVEKKYAKYAKEIDKAIKNYQKEWNKIGQTFSDEIDKIAPYKWFYDTYYVVVSPFHPGVSSKGGDKVIRGAFEDPKEQLRITAHEILMSHIWNILFELYPESEESADKDMHYWAINEITTVAILGLEESLNALWTDKLKGFDNFLSNYPQLNKLKMELKEMYKSKKNVKDFLDRALDHLNTKYANVDLGVPK